MKEIEDLSNVIKSNNLAVMVSYYIPHRLPTRVYVPFNVISYHCTGNYNLNIHYFELTSLASKVRIKIGECNLAKRPAICYLFFFRGVFKLQRISFKLSQ